MPQVIEQGDIFGKIGKSFGEGLSEQIPKEIGRMRLKEGLKNFSEKTKDLSYPEQVAYLYGIPGVAESGIGNVILPYMQSEREREASTTFNKGQGFGVSEKPPSKEGVSAVSQEQPQEPEPSNLPPKFDRSASNYLTPLGAEDIDLQARELSSKYKIPFSRAQEIVQRKDDKRIAAEQAFEARNTLGESEYNKYLDTEIQKSKEAGLNDIIGELRNDYLTKVQNDIANGLTPRQAGLSRAKELLDFSKARNKLKIQGTSLGGEHKTTLEAAKRAFDKIGNPELFKNDLINNQ